MGNPKNEENEKITSARRPHLVLRMLKYIGLPILILAIVVGVLAISNWPVVSVEFENYSGPHGYGTIWQAVVDVDGGRPAGVNNLFLKFHFPNHITKVEKVTDGGCKDLKILTDPMIDPSHAKWDRVTEKSGRVFASECPDGAKLILRFETAGSVFDERPCPDEGSYEGGFDWSLPVLGTILPWSILEYGSSMKGIIPPSAQQTAYIATHGYPASLSGPPYYNLSKRTGRLVSILDPRDFNNRLDEGKSICFFSRPSTKLRMYMEKGGIVVAHIHWIHCEKPILIQKKFKRLDTEQMAFLNENGLKAGIELKWSDCEAHLAFTQVRAQ